MGTHVAGIVVALCGRDIETDAAYRNYAPTMTECVFCPTNSHLTDDVVDQQNSMLVIRNIFPYAAWDSLTVLDHLLIIPTRHTTTLDDFTDAEALDFFTLMRRYERNGYSVYTRSTDNPSRSIGHVHTHVIKTGAKYGAGSEVAHLPGPETVLAA